MLFLLLLLLLLLSLGEEGYSKTLEILKEVENNCNNKIYNNNNKLTRPIFTQSDLKNWEKQQQKLPHWIHIDNNNSNDNNKCLATVTIKNGILVNSQLYLKELFNLINKKINIEWVKKSITTTEDINEISNNYDVVIVTCGANINNIIKNCSNNNNSNNNSNNNDNNNINSNSNDYNNNSNDNNKNNGNDNNNNNSDNDNKLLNIKLVKGQNIITTQKESAEELKDILLCGEYIIPQKVNGVSQLLCGATHEYLNSNSNFDDNNNNNKPNINIATNLLKDKLSLLYDNNNNYNNPIDCYAGIRVVSPRLLLLFLYNCSYYFIYFIHNIMIIILIKIIIVCIIIINYFFVKIALWEIAYDWKT